MKFSHLYDLILSAMMRNTNDNALSNLRSDVEKDRLRIGLISRHIILKRGIHTQNII